MNRCLNIIILYDNTNDVIHYLLDACHKQECYVDFAVVINKDTDHIGEKKLLKLKQEVSSNIYIFDFNENIGYMNSLLFVLQENRGFLDDYKYIILSNTDIVYKTPQFFQKLLNKNYEKNIGVIAPSVYATKSCSYSNPHYLNRISDNKIIQLIKIFSSPKLSAVYVQLSDLKAKFKKTKEMDSCYVYSPHGCYMIFSSDFLKKIYGWKYGVKMYSEESFVGELLRLKNMQCYFDSTLKVVHNERAVTGTLNYTQKFKYMSESLRYIYNTFYK